jgi:CheY-like chemotaxis protein
MFNSKKTEPLHVLSIGTKILIKDVMDTYLRSLGEVKTFYASKMSTALETYRDKRPQIIFCEHSFPEGSALEFIRAIGGLPPSGDQYFVLASEEHSDALVALASEKGMDEILVKPFSAENIHQIVKRYKEKKESLKHDWVVDLRNARKSFEEKRFQEAEELYAAASKKYEKNSMVQLEVADFFVARNLLNPAKSILEWILSESPENVTALQLMGTVYKKAGKLKEASDKLRKSTALSPINSLRQAELAEIYVLMAEEQIVQALKLETENSNLILARARFQMLRKDCSATVTYLDVKKPYLSEAAKKEAEILSAICKKLGGIK